MPGRKSGEIASVRKQSDCIERAATVLRERYTVSEEALKNENKAVRIVVADAVNFAIRLLNRTRRSVAPIEAGEQLLRRLRPALSEVSEAVDAINNFRHKPTGTVRINAPAPAIAFVLAPLVKPFLDAYPDVALELISDAAKVDIVDSGFDAGVRFGEELAQDMIAVPLGPSLRYIVIGTPDYLELRGTPRERLNCCTISASGSGFLAAPSLCGGSRRRGTPSILYLKVV